MVALKIFALCIMAWVAFLTWLNLKLWVRDAERGFTALRGTRDVLLALLLGFSSIAGVVCIRAILMSLIKGAG